MCNVCCKEFRGWCKSFTRTEALLSLLEAVLLLVFIGLLTFLILHFLACSKPNINYQVIPPKLTDTPQNFAKPEISDSLVAPESADQSPRGTLAPDVQCTWEPSKKTEAPTHYYEEGAPVTGMHTIESAPRNETYLYSPIETLPAAMEDSDGEEVAAGDESFLLALVKIRPMREDTFGCVLSAVSRYWALTAASCVEAAEEVDVLEAFVMVEGYARAGGGGGGGGGAAHGVADVRVHPQHARGRRDRDLAALRSEDPLNVASQDLLRLPSLLEHLLITIGERLTIYGYGRFRSPESSTSDRGVRAVGVYRLPAAACADSAWAPRHLGGGAPTIPATGEIGPVCAGPLYARGVVCNYCAGTPLTRGRTLLALMADAARCGAACEPARYVALAAARPWLDDLLAPNIV